MTEIVFSPSGRFRLEIEKDDHNSKGRAYETTSNKLVVTIDRQYGYFQHSFVTKDGEEYLISGTHYTNQTLVDLDTGERFDSDDEKNQFCWAACYLSPDGNTLVVDGCFWGGPYFYKFFDFSDPSKGWPELKLVGEAVLSDEHKAPDFVGDEIHCFETTRRFRATGQLEDSINTDEEIDAIGEAYDDDSNWDLIIKSKTVLRRVGTSVEIVSRDET